MPNTLPAERKRYAFPLWMREFLIVALRQTDGQAEFSASFLTAAKKQGKSTALAALLRAALELPICVNPLLLVAAPSIVKGALAEFVIDAMMRWPGSVAGGGLTHAHVPFKVNRQTNSILRNPDFFGPGETGALYNMSEGTAQQTQSAPRGLIVMDELGRQSSLELFRQLEASRRSFLQTSLISVSILGDETSPHVQILEAVTRAKRKDV